MTQLDILNDDEPPYSDLHYFVNSENYRVPDLNGMMKEKGITDCPTLNSLASLVAYTVHDDADKQDPFKFEAGSAQEEDLLNPPSHALQHLGTRTVDLSGGRTRADLFVIDLAAKRKDTEDWQNDELHSYMSLRVLLTEPDQNHDGTVAGPTSAVLSIDNFHNKLMRDWMIKEDQDGEDGDHEQVNDPTAFVVKIPASLALDIRSKIGDGGVVGMREPEATSLVEDVDKILFWHFDGTGTVEVSESWAIPMWLGPYEGGAIQTSSPRAVEVETEWDLIAREELAKAVSATDPDVSVTDPEDAAMEELFRQHKKDQQSRKASKRLKESKKSRRIKYTPGSEPGPSGTSHDG